MIRRTLRYSSPSLCRVAFATFAVFLLTSGLSAQTVVVGTNIEFVQDMMFPPANHRGTILQLPTGNTTSVWFDYDGSHLTAVTWNLDEESDWYVVNEGDPFGFDSIASDQFEPIFTVDNPRGPVFVGTDQFYLGVSTSGQGLPVPFPTRNVFGWVQLQNVAGQLVVIDNAVAYDSLGIFVGTYDVIPEPSTLGLVWIAIAVLQLKRQR